MHRIAGVARHYDWGHPTALPELVGREPDGRPWAELWFGAHPSAPSPVVGEGRTLDQLIAADPSVLGDAAGGTELPFLSKVIAASRPLSVQAHPSAEQARAGFAREEAAGIPRDAPDRVYPDDRPKPELLCALTAFEAKCGFRPVAESLELLAALDCAALAPMAAALRASDGPASVNRAALGWALTLDPDTASRTVGAVVDAAASARGTPRFADELDWIGRMAAHHPGDPGLLATLLLAHVRLSPGEAIFLPAGNLHCYLGGTAVEAMASSDNVVRGGLTAKHVDVDELLAVVDTEPGSPEVQAPRSAVHRYDVPAAEFSLERARCGPEGSVAPSGRRPTIVLVVEGEFDVAHDHEAPGAERVRLGPGDALWQGAGERCVYRGEGLVFVTSTTGGAAGGRPEP